MLLCWHFNFEISDLHVAVTIVNHLYDAKLINTYGTHTHTHNRLTALFPGLPGSAGTRKVKPIWILLKQETVSGSSGNTNVKTAMPFSSGIRM